MANFEIDGSNTCWKELITLGLDENNEYWNDVIEHTLTEKGMCKRFDSGYGIEQGEPFTLWTKDWVYFPICYDGAEWVGSIPRNPCDIKTNHQGGG